MNILGLTETPEIYIVDFYKEQLDDEYPLMGPRGDFLLKILALEDPEIMSKLRVVNWYAHGQTMILKDIAKVKPKVVVSIGADAKGILVNTSKSMTEMSGNVSDIDILGYTVPRVHLYNPIKALKEKDQSLLFNKYVTDIKKIVDIARGTYVDILKSKNILAAFSFDEFKNICETHFINNDKLAYDIETNARPAMMVDSAIVGESFANENTGVYVVHDSLDFHMSDEETDKIWDYIKTELFDKKDKLIIHNTMYERPYTLYCKNYEIGFEKAEDTLVMSRLLRNPKDPAGLKFQAQTNLDYPDWETDLTDYVSIFKKIVARIGLGPKKFEPIYLEIKSGKLFEIKDSVSYNNLKDPDKEEIDSILDRLYGILSELYSDDEIINIGHLLSEKITETVEAGGIQDSTIPYNWIPYRVLSKYGAVDSIATYDLYNHFNKLMDETSTETVNLHKGYHIWLEHIYVAYIMERNGMYFDDDFAQKDRNFLVDQCIKCLKELLLSPVTEPLIPRLCGHYFKPVIFSDYLPIIAAEQGYKVNYNRDTGKYTLFFNGKRASVNRLNDIVIPESYIESYNSIIKELFIDKVESATTVEELTELYNPSSVTFNWVPREVLLTPDLQIADKIGKLNVLYESAEYEEVKDTISFIDKKFLEISHMLCNPDLLKETFGKDIWAKSRRSLFLGFCSLLRSSGHEVSFPEVINILHDPTPFTVESFDDAGIISIYNNMVLTGIDQDDETTWSDTFRWMINYRIFKKSNKLVSSYIDGSVGRKSIAIVDKKGLSEGKHDLGRKRNYYDGFIKPNGQAVYSDDEGCLLMAKWSPNTAETGRWRSALHTVPWGSQVKKYYSSRFPGGITCCPDYSQMEVRTLAAISKDKNMLELFYSGKDFHTETAKKIYRKDEVTSAERRFSKAATFSLLYGSSVESFAKAYCKGDMDYANMVFDGFFTAYPSVKEWVEARHEEVQKDHRVSLELSGRFIQIPQVGDGPGAVSSMLRKAQNYPIQAQSADLTGCVIFDLQKYIEENHMKSLVFMYVHDSIEVDIYPYEMLQFITYMKFLLNESPKRRMGLISHADVALGKSLGHEIELEEIETNEEMTEGWLTLKGYKDEIDDTVDVWKTAYKTVEVYDEDYKEEFVSMGDLFIMKKAYTPTLGTTRYNGSCKVHIKYYD